MPSRVLVVCCNFDAMWAGARQLCSLADLCCCYLLLGWFGF